MSTDTSADQGTTEEDHGNAVKMFGFKVWTYRMGEQVSLGIHLGDRLGLYRAMAGQGPITSQTLADALEFDERIVREWLLGQAAARLIDHDPDAGTFELTDVQSAVLAEEESSIAFAAGAFNGGASPDVIERIADSFRTGLGLTYEQQGPAAASAMARMTGPWSRQGLIPIILPALEGVVSKLEAGATVLDIGCGAGLTLCVLAQAFPNARCVGYDPSETAVGLARARAAELGLTNVDFVAASGDEVPAGQDFDLVMTFDCLHDMAHPDRTIAAIRRTIAADGTWLVKDIRSTGDFERDMRNPLLALFYGFSIASCLQSAVSVPDGMGLGTLGLHPERLREMVTEAGFGQMTVHDLDDAANLYYEVKVS